MNLPPSITGLLFIAVTGLAACAGGREARPVSTRPSCPPPAAVAALPRPEHVAVVLDGRLVDARGPLPLPADSVFGMQVVSDSAGLAAYGLCPGTHAMVVTSIAEAARRGLRPPPPPLCVRWADSRHPLRMAVPVGQRVLMAAGQRDLLDECDRAAPPGARWASGDSAVLRVDSAGLVTAQAPGQAEVIVTAAGGEARLDVVVVPPVARIGVLPSDTTITVGDTVTFRALAHGADGQTLPAVPLALEVTSVRASEPTSGALAVQRVWAAGRQGARPPANTIRVTAHRAGVAWVRAAVVGLADSVRIRAVAR